MKQFSYKDPEVLSKYLDKTGKIRPRHETGLTKWQQRQLNTEVKKARQIALLPR